MKTYYTKRLPNDGGELARLGLLIGVYERESGMPSPHLIAAFRLKSDAEVFAAAMQELHGGRR